MTAENKYPEIPDRLKFYSGSYEVLTVFKAQSTIFKEGESGEETVTFGLILPVIPGEDDFTPGFDMNLVKIVDGEFSSSVIDSVRLAYDDSLGFIIAGAGYPGILLDKEDNLVEYRELGMSKNIDFIKQIIKKYSDALTSEAPEKIDRENAALLIAPFLARFFVLTPEELK